MKKTLSIIILVSMCLTTNVFAEQKVSDWAKEPFTVMQQKELIPQSLEKDENFQEDITREEFAELVTTYFLQVKPQSIQGEAIFEDTANPLVQLAGRLEIVNGTDDGEFSPNEKLTREQASTMFTRVEKMLDEDMKSSISNTFNDKNKIASWANEGVSTMNKEGVIKGYPDNTFKPQNAMSKEQAIVVTARMAKKHGIVSFDENIQTSTTPVLKDGVQPIEEVMKNYPKECGDQWILKTCKNGMTVVDTLEPNVLVGTVVMEKIELSDNGGNVPVTTMTLTLGEGKATGGNVIALMKDGYYKSFIPEPTGDKHKKVYMVQCSQSDIKTIFIVERSRYGLAVNIPNR